MQAVLDGSCMDSRQALHAHLAERLQLPANYGRNLDALFDLLTERGEETEILVTNWADLEQSLGHYSAALMDTLYDAARENPKLHIIVN